MNQFFRNGNLSKSHLAGRAPVIAVALLFLVAALLSALPSRGELYTLFQREALAGYQTAAETTPERSSVLGEFYDTPAAVTEPEKPDETVKPESTADQSSF